MIDEVGGGLAATIDLTAGLTIVLTGELDLAGAPVLRETVDLVREHQREVVVDLSGLDFVDCRGIALLLGLQDELRDAGNELLLRGPLSPPVGRVVEVTDTTDRLFPTPLASASSAA